MRYPVVRWLLNAACMILVVSVLGCSSAPSTPETPSGNGTTSEGTGTPDTTQGEQLVQQKCTQCHSLERVVAASYDRATWEETVTRMEGNGLKITPDEKAAIVDYLAAQDGAQ